MQRYTIGIDVGGTKTAYGVFDESKSIIKRHRHPSDKNLSSANFFDVIAQNIETLLAECDIKKSELAGIGIGMPSFIIFDEGHIVKTTNLTKIKDFPARAYLAKNLGGVEIVLDNDSHTGALAEHRHGAGRGFQHMLYCPISTGISSGIIIDGKLFRGSNGCSGESGHMLITPDEGVGCGCDNRGCFMSCCSGSMIVKHIQDWIQAGGTTLMTKLAGAPENIDCGHIEEAYNKNDEMAQRAVRQMAHYLGVWLYNLYVTLNINCIVLGGGLLKMGDMLFAPVRETFDRFNQNDLPVYIKKAELGDDFGIIGAAELLI